LNIFTNKIQNNNDNINVNNKQITMYCKCGTEVHPVRLNYGYKTCTPCSTTEDYSYIPIINHKTGNTIQIVSQEVSASVHRAWRRK
jgi:hypothetical protein